MVGSCIGRWPLALCLLPFKGRGAGSRLTTACGGGGSRGRRPDFCRDHVAGEVTAVPREAGVTAQELSSFDSSVHFLEPGIPRSAGLLCSGATLLAKTMGGTEPS